MSDLQSLLFLCPLIFLAGFVDSVAGGGGVISLPAFMFTGMPAHSAYACNKFSASCGTTFAAGRYLANRVLDLRVALISAAGSFLGATIASRLVLMLRESTLKMMLLVILPVAAALILFKRSYGEEDRSAGLSAKKRWLLAAAIGLGIGMYDGLFGPGTGTFAIMAYTMLMKYDLRTASGNAKLLNLASNYASVVTFALAGTILYQIAIPTALCNIAGGYLGSGFAIKKGAKFIRPVMMVVVVLLLGKMALDFVL